MILFQKKGIVHLYYMKRMRKFALNKNILMLLVLMIERPDLDIFIHNRSKIRHS